MIFDKVYPWIEQFDSLRMFIYAYDRELYRFCTRHTMLNVFRSSSTTIRQLYFITKMPLFGLYEYKAEGSGCGFNRKLGLVETDSQFIIKFDIF